MQTWSVESGAAPQVAPADAPPADHVHPWPRDELDWAAIRRCSACGEILLREFIRSRCWVVRRVERIAFLDDRTVRRRVSIDYLPPAPAVALQVGGAPPVRVIPLAIMRRKSLVNFDLIGPDAQPMSLVGLREAQAFTEAIARGAALGALDSSDARVGEFIEQVVSGDQDGLDEAYQSFEAAADDEPLGRLRNDTWFRAVIDRLSDSFILFAFDGTASGGRQIIKLAFDEPLTLRYREAGYTPAGGGAAPPSYGEGKYLKPWKRAPLLARLGLTPTLIRFPVPAAELAASFHFEVAAPPDVSIAGAQLVAGRPNAVRPAEEARAPEERRRQECEWMPSFDAVTGGYPTIDLHVADVPYGSLSRAQVALQANPSGWLSTAVLACCVSTATLTIGWAAHHGRSDVGATLLVTFAAALVALLVRPDPHRMITRLLSSIRLLAATSAMVTFGGALAFAFAQPAHARPIVGALAIVSLFPTSLALLAWITAIRRLRERPQRSPWEQRRPSGDYQTEPGLLHNTEIRRQCRSAERPYDTAVRLLDFEEPAIKVASSEGCRRRFELDPELLGELDRCSDRE